MIVYKFYKPDCAPCYALQRVLSVTKIPEGITIKEVNVSMEENKNFAKENGIDAVPVLMLENGKKLMGSNHTRQTIIEFLQSN